MPQQGREVVIADAVGTRAVRGWDPPQRWAPDRAACRSQLLEIAAEAVIRQDEAEELLARISRRERLADLAPRVGPLVSRFIALGEALPHSDDAELDGHACSMRAIFDHHAFLLSSSIALLAVDWRSDRVVQQLERLDGLGPPARRLDAIRARLL